MQRQMHLVAYLKTGPTARHVGGWRHPEATLDDFLDPERYQNIARLLEAARFDGCFFADLFGLYDIHGGSYDAYVRRGGQISYLDPTVVLPVMAAVTRHLGLGATLSTSFHTPYHLARWLGSLDVMSKGRVAWNIVTSATNLEAQNAGLAELPPREQRYDRADEVLEACCALWDNWDDDAFILNKQAGIFADPAKVHYANYEGRFVRTRGPLSIPRSPQGRPVLMQAGSSDRGRDFAARWAEVIFTAQRAPADMRSFRDDIHARMAARGRAAADCAILPALSVVIGETASIARERADYLRSLIDPELATANTSSRLGADLTRLQDRTSVAALQGNQGMRGSELVLEQAMKAEGLSLAQVALTGGESEVVGTPEMIADHMQAVFESGACDGFVVAPTYFPACSSNSAAAWCRSPAAPRPVSPGVRGSHPAGEPAKLSNEDGEATMRIFGRRIALSAVLLGLALLPTLGRTQEVVPAARAALPDAMRSTGVLRVATSLQWPPFAYAADGGAPDGIDIRLARLLAAKLGLRAEFEDIKFPTIIPGVTSGRYDIGVNQIGVTPERVKVVDFLTYFNSGYGLLTRAGATGLDINDLCSRTLVLTRGSAQVAVAEKLSADCVKAGRRSASCLPQQRRHLSGAGQWSRRRLPDRARRRHLHRPGQRQAADDQRHAARHDDPLRHRHGPRKCQAA